jgi:hypothetical protein
MAAFCRIAILDKILATEGYFKRFLWDRKEKVKYRQTFGSRFNSWAPSLEDSSMKSPNQQDHVMDPDSREFLLLQFKTLRDEILGKTERVVRIQIIGVTAIPLVIGAGEKYGISSVLAAAPIVTVVFALILLYEQNGIMRAGKYLRVHLETLFLQHLTGWEEWLEMYPVNRRAEAFFARAAHIAFSLYYLGGSYLAFLAVKNEYGLEEAKILAAIYAGGFLLALYFVVTNFATSTRAPDEATAKFRSQVPSDR